MAHRRQRLHRRNGRDRRTTVSRTRLDPRAVPARLARRRQGRARRAGAAGGADDPTLGIASGTAFEYRRNEWRQRHVAGGTVWGASRAYRWECLTGLLPLEERIGWDGLDEFKANARSWRTQAFGDLAFLHHRREGERDGSTWRARWNQGDAAHYFGYRAWYLVLRSLWHARHEPAALAMIWGYAAAALKQSPRTTDDHGREYLRRQQSFRLLRLRALEAVGRGNHAR